MLKPTSSPWGAVQDTTVLADGILSVSTASHGGIKLNAIRQALMPAGWRQDGGWYEEDCDWCLPFIIFQADILTHGDECAINNIRDSRHVEILKDWHPDKYEEWFKTTLKTGESYLRTHPLKAPVKLVKIKPKWCDCKAEQDVIYEVIEDLGDRCVIELLDCDLPIKPTQTVQASMLDLVIEKL